MISIYTVYIYIHTIKFKSLGSPRHFHVSMKAPTIVFSCANHHLKKMTFLSDPKFVNGSVYISYDRDIHLFDIDICTSIHLISALLPL